MSFVTLAFVLGLALLDTLSPAVIGVALFLVLSRPPHLVAPALDVPVHAGGRVLHVRRGSRRPRAQGSSSAAGSSRRSGRSNPNDGCAGSPCRG